MSPDARDQVLVGLRDIAKVAGVGPSAVSNWRSRHEDFPSSRHTAGGADLFSLGEVEAWLVEKGKLDRPAPASVVVWAAADALRGVWQPRQVITYLLSALVYRVACTRAWSVTSAYRISVPAGAGWEDVAREPGDRRPARLLEAAGYIEAANPFLEGLLVDGLDQQPEADPTRLGVLLQTVDALPLEDLEDVDFFHELMDRHYSANRFDEAHGTPDDVAYLMIRLAEPLGTVIVDPAVGYGGLLLFAGLYAGDRGATPDLHGLDIDPEAVRWARCWAFIYDMPANLSVADALRTHPGEVPAADTVLIDPPFGLQGWGDAKLYLDPRWAFGPPPPSSADFAWLQAAVNLLNSGGRAVVCLPPRATFAGGRERDIRQAMLASGLIEAVIQLPARLRRDISIPITVWTLRSAADATDDQTVLLVDASRLGTPGRARHDLDEPDIDRLADLVHAWRRQRQVPGADRDIAVAVDAADLDDVVVTPARYLVADEHVDVNQLRSDVERLRAELAEAAAVLHAAVGAITHSSGSNQ